MPLAQVSCYIWVNYSERRRSVDLGVLLHRLRCILRVDVAKLENLTETFQSYPISAMDILEHCIKMASKGCTYEQLVEFYRDRQYRAIDSCLPERNMVHS